MMTPFLLSTKRLTLRPTKGVDETALAETFSHPDMGPWIWFIGDTPPSQFARDWCARAASAKNEYLFSILLNETYIGSINLHLEGSSAEVGYWLHPAHQGKGYVQEALTRVIEFVFGELRLDSIFATFAETNSSSAAVLHKCGFGNAEKITVRTTAGTDRPSVKVTLFKASSPE